MHLIVGLGNPGPKYALTRHNIGFMVADFIAQFHRVHFKQGAGDYLYCQYTVAGQDVCLLKPLTFMNRSGAAVEQAMDRLQSDESQLLVIYDDFNLQFGTLRLRARGSDGGHNGMASIIYHLQSEAFPRLRIGIQNNDLRKDAADFVLSDFNETEEKDLPTIVEESARAAESVIVNGMAKTMNLYNRNLLNDSN